MIKYNNKKVPFIVLQHLYGMYKSTILKITLQSRIHRFNHQTNLEVFWTLFPIAIILLIAIPSFVLLFAADLLLDSNLAIKALGHQWYWSYECEFPALLLPEKNESMIFKKIKFDSYIVYEEELKTGLLRLLEVDNALYMPVGLHVKMIVTSTDVIHSWAVPSLGVKIDAVPGRLNQVDIFLEREGVFYGQCSELCGASHGFMPIKVIGVSFPEYISYCYSFLVK